MKVRIRPPHPGAGSWEDEQIDSCMGFCRMKDGAQYPESWREPLTEIVPEPGNIVEVWDDSDNAHFIQIFQRSEGKLYRSHMINKHLEYDDWDNCRVLARKPKGWSEAKDATWKFLRDIDCSNQEGERIAYETFLSAILGTEYAKIE